MTTQEKLQAIKDSLLSGTVHQRDVDGTDCRYTKKILSGVPVSAKVVDRIYKKLKQQQDCLTKIKSQSAMTELEARQLCEKYGFTFQAKTRNNKVYFYACKRVAGKISWVALGSDRDLAESKLVDQVRMNEITESLHNL